MSYEFKKLGAVEALTEMPANANALVEVDGAIKRVPASAASGGTVEVDATLTEAGTAADAKVVGDRFTSLSEEIAEDDLPTVYFGNGLPQTKIDSVMTWRFVSKAKDIKCYCTTKAQGNSSMYFPKKNQTVKVYSDLACENKVKIAFRNWGAQNKFCIKANWNDLSHMRNVISARIWGDVVRARSDFDSIPELMRTSPNFGAIDGFPVRVFAGGVYQGRYAFNIPKDKWMANMDDENPNHCILCSENYGSGCFRATALIDGSDWTDEIHDTVPDNIKTRWNECISFVMNSTDEEFVAGLADYFNVTSLIDYHIFGLASCHMDGFGKNQIFLTYDGRVWYASVYDMDATWGNHFMGTKLLDVNYSRTSYEDYVSSGSTGDGNLLYVRLEALFADAIKARWEELRASALSADNIISHFEQWASICPPWLIEEDYAETTAGGAFVDMPGKTTNNIQQIRAYVVGRLAYVHKYLTGESENLWSLAGKTEKVATVFGTPTSNIDIEYGTYSNGVNRAGYWQYMPDKFPGLVIDGDNVEVTTTRNDNSGYGIGVPIKLMPGASYKVSFDVDGKGTFTVMYYNAEGIYQTRAEFNSISAEGGHYEQTFTMPDYEHAVFVAASNWQHTDPEPTARFTNIKIGEV